jgi:hypothetical protein
VFQDIPRHDDRPCRTKTHPTITHPRGRIFQPAETISPA